MSTDYRPFLRLAIAEAELAVQQGNPPFGAVLLGTKNDLVERGHNTELSTWDPSAHAEVNVLRAAGARLKTVDFTGFTIISNAEPCSMCSSLGMKRGIRRFVFGAPAERGMEPWLPVVEVAKYASRGPIRVVNNQMIDECIESVSSGRAALDARA